LHATTLQFVRVGIDQIGCQKVHGAFSDFHCVG
jgi:hypothetical protein